MLDGLVRLLVEHLYSQLTVLGHPLSERDVLLLQQALLATEHLLHEAEVHSVGRGAEVADCNKIKGVSVENDSLTIIAEDVVQLVFLSQIFSQLV